MWLAISLWGLFQLYLSYIFWISRYQVRSINHFSFYCLCHFLPSMPAVLSFPRTTIQILRSPFLPPHTAVQHGCRILWPGHYRSSPLLASLKFGSSGTLRIWQRTLQQKESLLPLQCQLYFGCVSQVLISLPSHQAEPISSH